MVVKLYQFHLNLVIKQSMEKNCIFDIIFFFLSYHVAIFRYFLVFYRITTGEFAVDRNMKFFQVVYLISYNCYFTPYVFLGFKLYIKDKNFNTSELTK